MLQQSSHGSAMTETDDRIADGCDLANGNSRDRNGNGVPDECEIERNGQRPSATPVSTPKIRHP